MTPKSQPNWLTNIVRKLSSAVINYLKECFLEWAKKEAFEPWGDFFSSLKRMIFEKIEAIVGFIQLSLLSKN